MLGLTAAVLQCFHTKTDASAGAMHIVLRDTGTVKVVFGRALCFLCMCRPLWPACLVCLQVMYLRGLRYIYQFNIFLYMMMGIMGLSLLIMVIKGPGKWKRAKREDAYKF